MSHPQHPLPENERERLAALHDYSLLDSAPERATDDIVEIASQICQVPIALVVLLDEHRQWFKAAKGLSAKETSRDVAFCAHTILTPQTMVVPDATMDKRFVDNPLVTGTPNIRFYAGVPLLTPDGHALGTLCVINDKPQTLSDGQRKALEALARQTMAQFELRRVSKRLADSLQKLEILEKLLPLCGWCKKVRDDQGYWSGVESYLESRTDISISHGICPECVQEHFPPDPLKP